MWTFQNITQSIPAVPFSVINAKDLKIELQSQAISKCTFTVAGAFDGGFLANFEDLVVIADPAGVTRFVGNVTKPSAGATGGEEHTAYEISCPWWWLEERLTFRQFWTGRGNFPRVIIGQNIQAILAGYLLLAHFTAGQQIQEILEWAISCNAPFQYTTPIPDGPQFPFVEKNCVTPAECLKHVLKWMGSVNTVWDFTTLKEGVPCPTLTFVPRVAMTAIPTSGPVSYIPTGYPDMPAAVPVPAGAAKAVTIGEDRLQGVPDIAAAYQRQVPSVCIYYETKNTSNDGNSTIITEDFYPLDATSLEPGALVQAMELSGSQSHFEKQQIVAKPWPAVSNLSDFSQYIWNTQPAAQQVLAANVQYYGSTAFAVALPGLKLDGVTATAYTTADLGNELVQGNITPWMESAFSIKHGKVQFGLMVYYNGTTASTDYAAAMQMFGGIGPAFAQMIYCEKRCTNAVSQLYQYLSNYTSPETVPTGIAQTLYTTLSQLNWTGTISLLEAECTFDITLGNLINVIGGKSAWTTMLAPPQSITYDIDRGQTSIKLGLPAHLGLTDYVDLLKSGRVHASSEKTQERVDNKGESTQTIDGTTAGPHSFSTPPGGGKGTQLDFALSAVPETGGAADKLGIYSGTVSDTMPGGVVWPVTGLTPGSVTPNAVAASGAAWLVISYDEAEPPNILSVSFSYGASVPPQASGTLYVPLGTYTVAAGKITITSAPIGSQAFEAWRDWFSYPVTYSAECGPV